ncbi:proton-conducting transporter membrane subunit [Deinococcus lacus]|uniref:Proton-conducting transporter membrane subunit n=1 Tax=Deinococcus lacus TaxID=392561 RepID=A0ABW1YH09_9DEIO
MIESWLPAAPVLISLGAGLLLLAVRGRTAQVLVSLLACLLTLVCSAGLTQLTADGSILSHSMGGWKAPFGIVMVADRLGAWMSVLAALSALLATLQAAMTPDRVREKYWLFALMQLLFAGVQMSFLTGDLFNLFVAFEVMLVASYALAVLGSTREQLREGFRYIVMNLVASALLVVTCGLIYGLLGTLNMAHLAQRSMELGPQATVTIFSLLLMLVFASKAALFPLGFWLPGTYPAVPPAVGAFFAAILTKVGVYALLRTFGTMFAEEAGAAQASLLLLGTVTMLYGALGMVSQREWRRILAFAVMASVGYLAFGLGLGTPAALQATLYYLGVSVMVTTAFFLLAHVAERISGTPLVAARGLLESQPLLAAAYLLCALTLAGLPPTAGFIAKYALVRAGLEQGTPLALAGTVSALLSSLVMLYALLYIWRTYFWGQRSPERPPESEFARAPAHLPGCGVGAGPKRRCGAAAGLERSSRRRAGQP